MQAGAVADLATDAAVGSIAVPVVASIGMQAITLGPGIRVGAAMIGATAIGAGGATASAIITLQPTPAAALIVNGASAIGIAACIIGGPVMTMAGLITGASGTSRVTDIIQTDDRNRAMRRRRRKHVDSASSILAWMFAAVPSSRLARASIDSATARERSLGPISIARRRNWASGSSTSSTR
jgi:hypothetical protein